MLSKSQSSWTQLVLGLFVTIASVSTWAVGIGEKINLPKSDVFCRVVNNGGYGYYRYDDSCPYCTPDTPPAQPKLVRVNLTNSNIDGVIAFRSQVGTNSCDAITKATTIVAEVVDRNVREDSLGRTVTLTVLINGIRLTGTAHSSRR